MRSHSVASEGLYLLLVHFNLLMMENVSIKCHYAGSMDLCGNNGLLSPGNHQTIAQMCDAAASKAPTRFADLIIVGYNIMNFQTDVMEMLHNANSRILMVWCFLMHKQWQVKCITVYKHFKGSIETTLHCIRDRERTTFVTFKSQQYDVICSITFHIIILLSTD